MIKDLNIIIKMTNMLKFISALKAVLTVGIIAFTVFRIFMMYKDGESV